MLGGARSPGGKRFRLISFRGVDDNDAFEGEVEDPNVPMGYGGSALGYGTMEGGGASGIRLTEETLEGVGYGSGPAESAPLWSTPLSLQPQGFAPRPMHQQQHQRPQQSIMQQQQQQQAQLSQGLQTMQLQQHQLDGRYGGNNVSVSMSL